MMPEFVTYVAVGLTTLFALALAYAVTSNS